MRFIFHLLGILFFLIWITIGTVILAGLMLLATTKPWQNLSSLMPVIGSNPLASLSGLMSQTGDLGELVKKMSSGKDITQSFQSLPKATQDCLTKELGQKTINDALAGKLQSSPDLIFKAMKCLK